MNLSEFFLRTRDRARWLYWDSATGAATYAIVYGSASATYSTSISVGAVLKYKINDLGLSTGGTYYMAVKAVDSAGTASSASNALVIRDGTQIG